MLAWVALRLLLRAAVIPMVVGVAVSGCLLTNINQDDCVSDNECIAAFGYGSSCVDGYCGEPLTCATGHDCRIAFGGGACVDGRCSGTLVPDPFDACTSFEPEGLAASALIGDESPLVIGAVFRVDDSSDHRRANAARLAIREVNEVGGLVDGREVAMVICDNGGEDNALEEDARRIRTEGVVDHLAGVLGVPFIVGPTTSSDSLIAVNHLLSQRYPTLFISPSATSPALTNQSDKLDEDDDFGLFWRTAPSDALQGEALAAAVVGVHPAPDPLIVKVAVMYIADAYGEGLANVFQQNWGASDTALHPFDGDADFAEIVQQAMVVQPDAIMIVAIEAQHTTTLLEELSKQPSMSMLPVYLTDGSKDAEYLLDPDLPTEVRDIIFNRLVGTAPAPPEGEASNLFEANFRAAFGEDPTGFSFTANAYDAAYVGAAGVVYASQNTFNFDGRNIAAGLARLISGTSFAVGKTDWPGVKQGLTAEAKTVDIVGVSGALDFDVDSGEPPAPIEVWRPTDVASECSNAPPCFKQIAVW